MKEKPSCLWKIPFTRPRRPAWLPGAVGPIRDGRRQGSRR